MLHTSNVAAPAAKGADLSGIQPFFWSSCTQEKRMKSARQGRLLGAAARLRVTGGNTAGSAGRPADGFSPVPACLLARPIKWCAT